MPTKNTGKKKSKKKATKKSSKKKTRVRKPAPRKKAATKKVAQKKKAVKKAAPKKKLPVKKLLAKKADVIEPGPQPRQIPPVEEPFSNEKAVGVITHYYSHLSVAVVQINQGTLRSGDTIRIKGHSTNFTQTVGSMEYEHQHADAASAGQCVGVKVNDHCREHDIVYLVK